MCLLVEIGKRHFIGMRFNVIQCKNETYLCFLTVEIGDYVMGGIDSLSEITCIHFGKYGGKNCFTNILYLLGFQLYNSILTGVFACKPKYPISCPPGAGAVTATKVNPKHQCVLQSILV